MLPVPEVDQAALTFGDISHAPKFADVPEEYEGKREWEDLVSRWFFKGLKGHSFVPKKNVDGNQALRAVGAVLRSFEPKHEHKVAICAWMLSEWFENVAVPDVKP